MDICEKLLLLETTVAGTIQNLMWYYEIVIVWKRRFERAWERSCRVRLTWDLADGRDGENEGRRLDGHVQEQPRACPVSADPGLRRRMNNIE